MNPLPWYTDALLVASFPLRFRALAWYFRLLVRPDGRVPGGSFLFRRLRHLTRWLQLRDTAAVCVDGHQVWVDLLDQRMLTVLEEIRFESDEWRVLRTLLSPGATFIDIGANHGSFSVRAARLIGPSGRVIAVEPNPRLAALVNRSLMDCGASYEVHAFALGSTSGTATLHVPADSSGSSSVYRDYGSGERQVLSVPADTVDRLLSDVPCNRPCVVKMDVEGAEAEVLRGARGFLRRVRPVVLWELNPESAAVSGGFEALFAAFEAAGYTRFAELREWPETRVAGAVCLGSQRNLLAVHL